jgi:hypothetical protein
MGIGATVRVVMESQAFGSPPASVNLVGPSEGSWSFGQLLPLLLLALPVISTVEIMRGETRTPPSRVDEDSQPLFAGGNDMEFQFQPNPVLGSNSNMFGK